MPSPRTNSQCLLLELNLGNHNSQVGGCTVGGCTVVGVSENRGPPNRAEQNG